MIKLIVGLGNPGFEYRATRHNAGFWFVDLLAQRANIVLRQEQRFHGLVGRTEHDQKAVWLLEPLTFMNRSGQAVAALARFHRININEILVVHDELDISPGRARLKYGGGSGGHNGLKDITALLGGGDFWRLRIGIGHPRDRLVDTDKRMQDVAAYVLKEPNAEEQHKIELVMYAAREALALLLSDDSAAAMQKLHTVAY